jgi:5-methylcytosine-specific restriction protein B
LNALARYFAKEYDVRLWVKNDPTDLTRNFPQIIRNIHPQFDRAIDRYGRYIYAAVEIPHQVERAKPIVSGMLDLYAKERGWTPLKAAEIEIEALRRNLFAYLFPKQDLDTLYELLLERRFVILQGPPSTGKTRLATHLLERKFGGNGRTIQFHPAVTYETFVVGISPAVHQATLNFEVKPGWLIEAIKEAAGGQYLLAIDEINRADLGRVLGESIYLFEPREVNHGTPRTVDLPLTISGTRSLTIPRNLYVIGTMNSADRSIAILDLAVRRRFAFIDIWPDFDVIRQQGNELAVSAFGNLLDIFSQYTPDDALVLMPGHAYFLAESLAELTHRLQYELMPLLNEYLQEGRLGPCESEIRAYLSWLAGEIAVNG